MTADRVTFLLGPLDGLVLSELPDRPSTVLVPHPVALVQGVDLYACYDRSEVRGGSGGLNRAFYCYTGSGPRRLYPLLAFTLRKEHFLA